MPESSYIWNRVEFIRYRKILHRSLKPVKSSDQFLLYIIHHINNTGFPLKANQNGAVAVRQRLTFWCVLLHEATCLENVCICTHTLWGVQCASRVCWMCKCVCVCVSADKQPTAVHTGQSVCGSYLQRVSESLQACDTRQLTQSNQCQPGLKETRANPSDCANKQTVL